MILKDYNFERPQELIAQQPVDGARDQSRLLILDRKTGKTQHAHFFAIEQELRSGDVLVMNNSKVIPARLLGKKKKTGGDIEILLVRERDMTNTTIWEAMIRWKNPQAKQEFEIIDTAGFTRLLGRLIEPTQENTWIVQFDIPPSEFMPLVHEIGHTPIPPYMDENTMREDELRSRYQTVFAATEGSVAAPTAGLHFTPELLTHLQKKGVILTEVTLHVGLGTFLPIKTDDVSKHVMHAEQASISEASAAIINKAKNEGRRVIAVGTTSVRTLESFAIPEHRQHTTKESSDIRQFIQPGTKDTRIFITPGYTFTIIDGMITNFHLPKSTLLLLVSAFAGREHILNAYQEAIQKRYRFFSFGDAMFIR